MRQRRIFKNRDDDDSAKFGKIKDLAGEHATMLIPFDIDMDGRMDLLVQNQYERVIKDPKTGEERTEITEELDMIYNN